MSIINKLKPRDYLFKDDAKYASLHLPTGRHYGLLAQDLEQVLPNLVSEAPHQLIINSKPEAAIKRELMEETGLELEQAKFVFARTLQRVSHLEIIFRCRARGRARARSLEVKHLDWFALDNLPDDLGRDQRLIIKRALSDGANERT